MVLLQPPADALLQVAAVGVEDQGVAVGHAGPEGAAQALGEEVVQVGVQSRLEARLSSVSTTTTRPPESARAHHFLGPGQLAQVVDGLLVQHGFLDPPAAQVPAGDEAVHLLALDDVA